MITSYFYSLLCRVKFVSHKFFLGIDLFCSILATGMSVLFLVFIMQTSISGQVLLKIILLSFLTSLISFVFFRLYKGVLRHYAFIENRRLYLGALMKVVIFLAIVLPVSHTFSFRELLLGATVDFFLTFFILATVRTVFITFRNTIESRISLSQDKLLVYLSDDSSVFTFDISMFEKFIYQMEGYLRLGDGDTSRLGEHNVYSVKDQQGFNVLVNRKNIKAILFVNNSSVKNESERLIRYCEKRKIKMLMLPSIAELRKKNLDIRNLPEVSIEDLLGREEICINMEEVAGEVYDKTVLVTGAAGSIGSELCRQLCLFKPELLLLLDNAETPLYNLQLELKEKFPDLKIINLLGDVRVGFWLDGLFRTYRPHFVFHAAAYKHVPLMEETPCLAVRTNVHGTKVIADISVKYGVDKFIMISSDKAVNPTNVMGASKRLAEIYIQSLGIAISKGELWGKTRFVTTRFGNVLGSNGSVVPRFREQLQKGGPITVTHPDIIRYFMTIPEACRLVLEAAYMGKGNEIFVFDMGTPVKIVDLAKRMIELVGLIPGKDIEIKFTGLRPGEKLYEELLAAKENVIETENKKIFQAHAREYDYKEIKSVLEKLVGVAAIYDKYETVRIMKEIIPEFKSRNSEFEVIDDEFIAG